MPKNTHTNEEKLQALDALETRSYPEVAEEWGVTVGSLRNWMRRRDKIREAYLADLRAKSAQKMALVQSQLAEKALDVLAAMDEERIAKAPLNQLSSALGTLIEKFLKLQEEPQAAEGAAEQVVRFEFRHPDGSLRATPYWAASGSAESGAVQGAGLRQTVRQNGTGEDDSAGERSLSRDADVVARSYVSDGESGLARFEADDDGRNWYHD